MADQDGPSILTSPPATLPDPNERPQLVPPPSPPPYRTPGEVARPRPAPRVIEQELRPEASPARSEPAADPIGDAAGEHQYMTRGRYSAWTYVVIAFLLESLMLGAPPIFVFRYFMPHDIATAIGLVTGAVGAYTVFRDRWRCIEAFSSRFCSGLMNLSILYVPFVSFVYANVRGLAKTTGK